MPTRVSRTAFTSNGVVEFTKQRLAHLPNRMRIIFRGDSGYFVGDLLELLDTRGHGYLIKVKLKNLVALLTAQNWTRIKGQPDWEQCVFQHRGSGWSRSREFVAVRVKRPKPVAGPQLELWDATEYDYYNSRVKFLPLAWAGMPKTSFRKNSDSPHH
jgi:hypothetical protein